MEEHTGNREIPSKLLQVPELLLRRKFTLEYWKDGDRYVGRLIEIPGVFSQGESLDELRDNVQEVYELMVTSERTAAPAIAQRQEVELEV
jgi:predicted RNase H-like HicB family nuclease